ncbi:hypothetical protein [Hydrocarboniphaga sp.]|uniref:hypothetical protein n=1 Tax=Hydrocarboniphaga sp. TaxID=2033016 RepID=UPI003D0C4CC2
MEKIHLAATRPYITLRKFSAFISEVCKNAVLRGQAIQDPAAAASSFFGSDGSVADQAISTYSIELQTLFAQLQTLAQQPPAAGYAPASAVSQSWITAASAIVFSQAACRPIYPNPASKAIVPPPAVNYIWTFTALDYPVWSVLKQYLEGDETLLSINSQLTTIANNYSGNIRMAILDLRERL